MKHVLYILLISAALYGCGSDSDADSLLTNIPSVNTPSTHIVSVSGGEIPAEADLAIVWFLPDDREFDEYYAGTGSLSNGTFFIDPPDPIPTEVISETYGVATGLIVAFRTGEAPVAGPYTETEYELNDYFNNAIGVVNNHMIVYNIADHTSPLLEGFDWWADRFDDGYSCAKSMSVEGDFDQFEPTDCSSMVLTIGILGEIEIIGGDWF